MLEWEGEERKRGEGGGLPFYASFLPQQTIGLRKEAARSSSSSFQILFAREEEERGEQGRPPSVLLSPSPPFGVGSLVLLLRRRRRCWFWKWGREERRSSSIPSLSLSLSLPFGSEEGEGVLSEGCLLIPRRRLRGGGHACEGLGGEKGGEGGRRGLVSRRWENREREEGEETTISSLSFFFFRMRTLARKEEEGGRDRECWGDRWRTYRYIYRFILQYGLLSVTVDTYAAVYERRKCHFHEIKWCYRTR